MEYKSHSNDFESNENSSNHELSMSKNRSGIQVRTLDNFQAKENKVYGDQQRERTSTAGENKKK